MGELSNVGVAAPEVSDPEQCPVGKGEIDCPVCGGRHQPAEVYVSDKLLESLEYLGEVQGK